MHIEAWDTVFVRARRVDVHAVLRDIAGYGRWWPGLEVSRAGPRLRLSHRPPGRLRRRHDVAVRVERERPDRGLLLSCSGAFDGELEWYYLDEVDGVTVHHLLRADTADRGADRRLAAHRASVRAALHALKDRLEGDRLPGAEPDARLLADQAAARTPSPAGAARSTPRPPGDLRGRGEEVPHAR